MEVQKSSCHFEFEEYFAWVLPDAGTAEPHGSSGVHQQSFRGAHAAEGHVKKPCLLQRSPLLLLVPPGTESVISPFGSFGVTHEEEEVWWSWRKELWRCSPWTN